MLAHFSYLIFWKIIFENLSRRMNWEIPRNRRTLFYGPISGTGDCRNSRSQNSCSGISKNRGICDRFVRDFRTKTGRGIEPMGIQEIAKIPGIRNSGINFFLGTSDERPFGNLRPAARWSPYRYVFSNFQEIRGTKLGDQMIVG